MTPHQMAKIPLYARHHIEKLETDLRHTQEQLKTVLGGDEESRVYLTRFTELEDQALPKHAKVGFRVPSKRGGVDHLGWIELSLGPNGEGVSVHGMDAISIEPSSSNACTISLREW